MRWLFSAVVVGVSLALAGPSLFAGERPGHADGLALSGNASLSAAAQACPPPSNDDVAASTPVASAPFMATQSTVCATLQLGEARPCADIGATVWYRFTPVEFGVFRASTAGSDYDTALTLYEGEPPQPALVQCDDDSGPGLSSTITFFASSGSTYWFQAGGFAGSTGTLQFALEQIPNTPTPTNTPTDTPTPSPTDTPTSCACTATRTFTPTATVTPTPTSNRPPVFAYIDLTVNGEQGPFTAIVGDTVEVAWIVTCQCGTRSFSAFVNASLDELDGTCDAFVSPCSKSIQLSLTEATAIDVTAFASVQPIPPSSSTPDDDTVKIKVIEPDLDGDGVANGDDNCASVPNVAQLNTDSEPLVTAGAPDDVTVAASDTSGDACDDDDDNDGLGDLSELGGCNSSGMLNPLDADSDGDRVRDGAECVLGSNPGSAASRPPTAVSADSDGDGIADSVEQRGYASFRNAVDTDGDGCSDDVEVASIDGNTVVSASDLGLIAQRFSATDKPVHDINKDRTVNSLDLVLAAHNFNLVPC